MNCAIIGSTKIAEVHAEQLLKNGIKEITFISRSKQKREKIISRVKKKFSKKVIFFHSDSKILKKSFFDIICICSNTEVHDNHLRDVSKLKSIIIVEKPIISLIKYQNKYKNFLTNIYKKNKKIIVCYPFLFLADSFKKFSGKIKKITKINFEFQTGGTAKFKKICINLMPHALTFFHTFLKKRFLKKKFHIENILVNKHIWKCQFKVNKILINLIFNENFMKKTFLKLKLNDKILIRKTKKNKKNFINYIKDQKTKKIKNINNPMEEFYDFFFKNINNTKYYKENKKITFDVMKKNNFFLN